MAIFEARTSLAGHDSAQTPDPTRGLEFVRLKPGLKIPDQSFADRLALANTFAGTIFASRLLISQRQPTSKNRATCEQALRTVFSELLGPLQQAITSPVLQLELDERVAQIVTPDHYDSIAVLEITANPVYQTEQQLTEVNQRLLELEDSYSSLLHDLRTPVTAAFARLQLAETGKTPKLRARSLSIAAREIRRFILISHDLDLQYQNPQPTMVKTLAESFASVLKPFITEYPDFKSLVEDPNLLNGLLLPSTVDWSYGVDPEVGEMVVLVRPALHHRLGEVIATNTLKASLGRLLNESGKPSQYSPYLKLDVYKDPNERDYIAFRFRDNGPGVNGSGYLHSGVKTHGIGLDGIRKLLKGQNLDYPEAEAKLLDVISYAKEIRFTPPVNGKNTITRFPAGAETTLLLKMVA